MKPLIICGGCSFTHAPDSWAQVLAHGHVDNLGPLPKKWAQDFYEGWKQYGIQIAGANPDIFPDRLQEYWEMGEDLSDHIDVIVVGQGAAGQELNSRVIRDVIQAELEVNPERKIGVFWQLSGWDRIEMLSNKWEIPWHGEFYKNDEHMTSIIRPWEHVPTELDAVTGHDPHDSNTRFEYKPGQRYWWKSGGASPEQFIDSPLEKYTKHYYEDVWTREYSTVKNLEVIEYTRAFCDQRDIPITILPGWAQTWDRAFDLGEIQSNLTGLEMLNRLPRDIVTDIDQYHGIAEWGYQHQIYEGPPINGDATWIDIDMELQVQKYQRESGSQFEKYWDPENNEFGGGNHPSSHIHALFCHDWIKPKVKQMLEKFN